MATIHLQETCSVVRSSSARCACWTAEKSARKDQKVLWNLGGHRNLAAGEAGALLSELPEEAVGPVGLYSELATAHRRTLSLLTVIPEQQPVVQAAVVGGELANISNF